MIAGLSGFLIGFVTAKVPAEWWSALLRVLCDGAIKLWAWLKDRIAKLKAMRGG